MTKFEQAVVVVPAHDEIDRLPHTLSALLAASMSAQNSKGPGHDHVHGANMGVRADAYWGVGGFRALSTGADVDRVERFEVAHLSIHRDAKLTVATSGREEGRAPGGFAAHLRALARPRRKVRAGTAS